MKRYASLAILMAAMTFAVSCNKENRDKGPSTLPKEKVSRIYRTAHTVTEMYNAIPDTWKTLSDVTNERKINYEFSWDGDRITRMKDHESDYTISYDDAGHIILANCVKGREASYEYSYDDDGLLSHSTSHSAEIHTTVDYTWANGHLLKSEMEWVTDGDESGKKHHETCEFTWNGDILSSSVRNYEYGDGTSGVSRYDYEYTSIPNPFQHFVFCMAARTGLFWTFDGIDGLVKNMYSRISNDTSDFSYEYTTSGGRIQTITETQVSENTTGVTAMRITAEVLYEIEYVD